MKIQAEKKWKIYLLRAVLTVLCLLVFAWIFSNSLKTAEQSSNQSHVVTDAVQNVAGVIAPDSSIANAEGKDYEKLHLDIRTLAHFSEFALLGALLIWCYFSYTDDKSFLVAPLGLVVITPMIDEYLQTFSSGRGTELADVLVDTLGGACGCAFALLTLFIGFLVFRAKKKKAARAAE